MSLDNLPVEWMNVKISDITVKGEQRKPNDSEEFIYVDIGSINRDLKKIESPQFLLGKDAPSRARKVIKSGDILVSLTRPNLNAVALVGENYDQQIASTGFEVISPMIVESKYLFSLVRTQNFINEISKQEQGALYPAAKSSDVQAYEFPLPPLAEQQEIVRQLDVMLAQVEQIKARLDAIPAILKKIRQSVLADAVSGKLTEDWRGTSELIGWHNKTLGDIAIVKTGKTPFRKESKYWENASIPWLTSSATGNNFTDSADEFISDVASKECNLTPFPKGTLLLAMYGEGKTRGQVTELLIEATCNQACAAILVNKEIAHTSFVKIRLLENYEVIRKAASGGNQPNLNLNKVREIDISLPTLDEQFEIVNIVKSLFVYAYKIEETVQSAQKRVNLLTQSILAKAFSGELTAEWREQHQELITGINSAESLLAKIQKEREASKPVKKAKKVK